MGRGKKKARKTHVNDKEEEVKNVPKALVFKRGSVGTTVKGLITDVRQVMLPFTAPKLKSNVIKDFVHVAGPLGVTHFMMFTQTDIGTYLKIARTPAGPTLTFQISAYSLAADVRKIQQRPHPPGAEFKTAPLLVLNGFTGQTDKHVELMKVTWKDMFPSLPVDKVNLDNCRRVVLVNYDPETEDLEFRHFLVHSFRAGVNKSIKNVVKKRVSDLSEYDDISEYVLGDLGASESDVEDGAEVTTEKTEKKLVRKRNADGERRRRLVQQTVTSQSKVRLQELGPRMTFKLFKVEEKMLEGEVHYHRIVKKSEEEITKLKAEKEAQKRLKEQRKKEQESRVKQKTGEDGDDEDEYKSGGEESEEDDNLEWYRREVGQEPDEETKELLQKSSADSGPNRKEQKRFQKTRKPNITGHKRKQSGDFQGKQDRQGKQGKQGWQGKGKQGGNQNGRTNRKDGPPQKKRRMSSSRK